MSRINMSRINMSRINLRVLQMALTCAALLAAGAAQSEPVKIRASWIVAPSDWSPLLPVKPELMKNNG
jgi:hypothetical protein